jgi:aspartyl-tRNA(Asn)/glutamyl-tRNA(Gln) amidotransferase subunit A
MQTVRHAQDPGRLRNMQAAIASGRLTPAELLERHAARIAAVDGVVRAWVRTDLERARQQALERTSEARDGRFRSALHGIPVAIKDVADVAGLPTLANSASRAGCPPRTHDAEIVLALKAAGAVVMGKVHTTEFAYFDPSPACNPHHLRHTPGGSSSGSAAAVASGMAPFAIGTQTVASVNRPAAYCGIAAFKPSTRSLSTFGLTPLAPSYDTPGLFGWSVDDAVFAYEAIEPAFLAAAAAPTARGGPSLGMPMDPHLSHMTDAMQAALDRTVSDLERAGLRIKRFTSPIDFARLFEIQRTTMLYEAGRSLAALQSEAAGSVGAKLLEAIGLGLAIPESKYLDERGEVDLMRVRFVDATRGLDVFIWPATPGPAPESLEWTGDPRFISPWTAIGGPIVSMPAGKAANGLPLGVSLCGKPGADRAMCAWARTIAAAAERHE